MIREPQADLDLGVVGNCAFAALVDRRARVAWACMPRFDGDPVFSGLLEGDGPENERSRFEVEIEGFDRSRQAYMDNTPVLVTSLHDRDGRSLEITDFAPRFSQFGRRYRPVALVRILRPVEGQPRIRIRIRRVSATRAGRPKLPTGPTMSATSVPTSRYGSPPTHRSPMSSRSRGSTSRSRSPCSSARTRA